MLAENILKTTNVFKLLSDPTRYRILDLLFRNKEGLCVNQIADYVNISHSAVSHQLAKLESKDIVRCERQGQTMCYQVKTNDLTAKLLNIIKYAQ